MSPPPKLSRRALTIGGIAGAGAALVAVAINQVPRLLRHRARGEYADFVNRLDDPEKAAVVGRAMSARAVLTKEELSELKTALGTSPLSDVAASDVKNGRLREADGWVLPATVAALCVLAAQAV
jgi:hypothetical protein